MYAYMTKGKKQSLVQRKTTSHTSDYNNKKYSNENSSFFSEKENPLFSAITLQYKLPDNPEKNIIQLKREDVKILPSRYGTDPTRTAGADGADGIGLSAHHVIPEALLESFYNMCMARPCCDDQRIASLFRTWRIRAKQSALATKDVRQGYISEDKKDPNYSNQIASASQWMIGNIHIGPSSSFRIDDITAGDAFDYGVFRDVKDQKAGVVNSRVTKMETTFNKMRIVLQNPPINPISREVRELICTILNDLIDIAKYNHFLGDTRNVPTVKSDEPTYDIKNWVSVGKTAIPGMEDFSEVFLKMHKAYSNRMQMPASFTFLQTQYYNLFEKHIDLNKCSTLSSPDSRYVMSKNTYVILHDAWESARHA